MTDVEQYLRQTIALSAQWGQAEPADYAYGSPMALVLDKGRPYQPAPLPPGFEQMESGMCFRNAATLAIEHGYTYVEGWAFQHIPTNHAWVTADGETAIDPTWSAGVSYFGVAFSTEFLIAMLERTGKYGIFESYDAQMVAELLQDGLPPGALAHPTTEGSS